MLSEPELIGCHMKLSCLSAIALAAIAIPSSNALGKDAEPNRPTNVAPRTVAALDTGEQSSEVSLLDAAKSVKLPRGFKYEPLVVGDIPEPLDLEFCPDGRLWFTGRRGQIWAYDFQTKKHELVTQLTVGWQPPPDNATNERGLHGIEFDPDFLRNGYIYVHYAPPPVDGHYTNRVSRFTADHPQHATGLVPGSEMVYLEIPSPRGFHQGGAIEYNPKDGKLYISAGDNNISGETKDFWNDPNNPPQRLDSLLGKILRLNLDGTIPADNPFVHKAGARGEIYTYGHRNPYSMNFDPETGTVYVGEVGYDLKDSYEEVNKLQSGGNYGWPRLNGPHKPIFPEPANPYPIGETIDPFITYDHSGGGADATSGPVYRVMKSGTPFPAPYRGGMFYADFSRKWIRFAQINPSTQKVERTRSFAFGLTGGVLSMHEGPDGGLYFVEYGGWFTPSPKDKLARIVYAPDQVAGK